MPNENTQHNTPEEAFASMGLATHLNEQMLMAQHEPQDATEGPVAPETATQQQEIPQPTEDYSSQIKELETRFADTLEGLKKEMSETIKKEVGGIREDIKNALEQETD